LFAVDADGGPTGSVGVARTYNSHREVSDVLEMDADAFVGNIDTERVGSMRTVLTRPIWTGDRPDTTEFVGWVGLA
jgi:hypothetical protein